MLIICNSPHFHSFKRVPFLLSVFPSPLPIFSYHFCANCRTCSEFPGRSDPNPRLSPRHLHSDGLVQLHASLHWKSSISVTEFGWVKGSLSGHCMRHYNMWWLCNAIFMVWSYHNATLSYFQEIQFVEHMPMGANYSYLNQNLCKCFSLQLQIFHTPLKHWCTVMSTTLPI